MSKFIQRLKLIFLGLLLYFLPIGIFRKYENKWFNVHSKKDDRRPEIVRNRFWKSVVGCLIFVVIIVLIQLVFFSFNPDIKYLFQVIGVTLVLMATFCRAGQDMDVQSCSGQTPIELIDRGMFTISYLGATGILLFILIL